MHDDNDFGKAQREGRQRAQRCLKLDHTAGLVAARIGVILTRHLSKVIVSNGGGPMAEAKATIVKKAKAFAAAMNKAVKAKRDKKVAELNKTDPKDGRRRKGHKD